MFLGIGLASFFWLPALNERKYVMFDSTIISNPFKYFISGETLYLLNAVQLSTVMGWIIFNRKKEYTNIFIVVWFLITIFLSTSLSAPFWSFNSLAKLVQFPYRLLSLASITGAYMVGIFINNTKKYRWILGIVFCIVLFGQAFQIIHEVKTEIHPEGFYTTNEATTTIADEYLPKWAVMRPEKRSYERIIWYSGSGNITPIKLSSHSILATVEVKEPSILQINNVYYPGWGVTLNNLPQPLDYKNNYGLMRLTIKDAGTYTLFAEFRETFSRFLADCLTGFSCIVYIIYLLHYRKKNIINIP
jgi:hypothetical protein